jgi:hypothetical protein
MSARVLSRLLVLAAVVVLPLLACAQRTSDSHRMRVLLERERMAQQFDTSRVVKNMFKLNPLLLLRGEVPLIYERALTFRLSAEVGIGFTMRNYMALTLNGDDADDIGAGVDIVMRPTYRGGFRYYLVDDLEPQGPYMQLEFAHLEYVKDIAETGAFGRLTGHSFRDKRTWNDLRLMVGLQQLGRSSNWAFDMYGGIGYRIRHEEVVHETRDLGTGLYTYSMEERNDHVPVLLLGVKVGLGF